MGLDDFKEDFVFYYFSTKLLVGNHRKTNKTTGQNYPQTLPEPPPEKPEIAYTPVREISQLMIDLHTPYSMNRLFDEFFRKFGGGFLGVFETI